MSPNVVVLVGRILLAIIFILSGFGKLANIPGTAGFFGSLGLPAPVAVAVVIGLVELIGGLAVLIGFKTRWGAYLLALFCVASALVAHNNFADQAQLTQFLKNVAIAGGFLVLGAYGPGAISVDARRT